MHLFLGLGDVDMLKTEISIGEAIVILERTHDLFVRNLLTWMLEVQGKRIVPDLCEILSHPTASVRSVSTNALGLIGSGNALEALSSKLKQGRDSGAIVRAIGRIGGQESLPLLLNIIAEEQKRGHWLCSGIAAYHIGRIGVRDAAPQLKRLLEVPKEHICDAAAQGLLLMGDPTAERYWRNILEGESRRRIRAVSLLSECPGCGQAVDLLVEVISNVVDPRVLRYAYRSLLYVTGVLPYPDVLPSHCSEETLQRCREYAVASLQCQLQKKTQEEQALRISTALACIGGRSQPLKIGLQVPPVCSYLWTYGAIEWSQGDSEVLFRHLADMEQDNQLSAACALTRHGNGVGQSFLRNLLRSYVVACQWLLLLSRVGLLERFIRTGSSNLQLRQSIPSFLFRLWVNIGSPDDMIGAVRSLSQMRDSSLIAILGATIRMARRDLRWEIMKAMQGMAAPATLPAISQAVTDPDPRVSSIAHRILGATP